MNWKNRIIGSGFEDPKKIRRNPQNWRTHSDTQSIALQSVLNEVGWVQEVIINKRTGNLVDGHLRVQIAAQKNEKEIPVKYVDLSEEEEELILITFDPISAIARADKDILANLIENIETENEILHEFIKDVEFSHGLSSLDPMEEWEGMPEFVQEEDPSYHKIVVHFGCEEDLNAFEQLVGQTVTNKTKFIWYPPQEDLGQRKMMYAADVNDDHVWPDGV